MDLEEIREKIRRIAGASDATFNGNFTVASVPNSTTFTYLQGTTIAVTAANLGGTATDALVTSR